MLLKKYRMHISSSSHRALEEIVSMSQAGTATAGPTAASTRTSAYDVEHTPGIDTEREGLFIFCMLFYYLFFYSILFVSAYKF